MLRKNILHILFHFLKLSFSPPHPFLSDKLEPEKVEIDGLTTWCGIRQPSSSRPIKNAKRENCLVKFPPDYPTAVSTAHPSPIVLPNPFLPSLPLTKALHPNFLRKRRFLQWDACDEQLCSDVAFLNRTWNLISFPFKDFYKKMRVFDRQELFRCSFVFGSLETADATSDFAPFQFFPAPIFSGQPMMHAAASCCDATIIGRCCCAKEMWLTSLCVTGPDIDLFLNLTF